MCIFVAKVYVGSTINLNINNLNFLIFKNKKMSKLKFYYFLSTPHVSPWGLLVRVFQL